jgi:hypothetical protein
MIEHNIYFLKLVTGEELIAQLLTVKKSKYIIGSPMVLLHDFEMVPWLPFVEDEISLKKSGVILKVKVDPEMVDCYANWLDVYFGGAVQDEDEPTRHRRVCKHPAKLVPAHVGQRDGEEGEPEDTQNDDQENLDDDGDNEDFDQQFDQS